MEFKTECAWKPSACLTIWNLQHSCFTVQKACGARSTCTQGFVCARRCFWSNSFAVVSREYLLSFTGTEPEMFTPSPPERNLDLDFHAVSEPQSHILRAFFLAITVSN